MTDGLSMSGSAVVVTFMVVVAVAIIIAKFVYRAGHKQGRADVLNPRPPTEAEQNTILMRSVLPLWRRVGARASIVVTGPIFLVLMTFAYRNGSGWAFLAAFLAWLAFFGLGFWLSEWFSRPFRKAQEAQRQAEKVKGRHSS